MRLEGGGRREGGREGGKAEVRSLVCLMDIP